MQVSHKATTKLLVAALAGAMALSGCTGTSSSGSSGANTPPSSNSGSTSSTGGDASGSSAAGPEEFSYPMDGSVTLSINATYEGDSVPEWVKGHYFWDLIQEKTGVKLEFVGSPSKPQETSEEFSLLLASGDYPDLMQANWITFTGGPQAALDDGYIIALDEYSQYFPSLSKILAENEQWNKDVRTDNGQLYNFPLLGSQETTAGTGWVLRQDYLDKVGLAVPETIDEWTAVLTAFKDQLNLGSPMTFESRWLFLEYATAGLSSAYGVCYPFYLQDGKTVFGPQQPGYKEWVTTLTDWYSKGLLDKDLFSVDKNTVQSKFASGEAGAALQQVRNVQNCIQANADNPEYKVVAAHSTVAQKGDVPQMAHHNNSYNGGCSVSISTQCKNIEAACRFLDYFYSDEGALFCTYGEQGFAWDYVDGVPTFNDLILNNPETPDAQGARYFVGQFQNGPIRVIDSNSHYMPEVREIQAVFQANMKDYAYPTVTNNSDEIDTMKKWADIDTYCRETITAFILGNKPLTEWDSFISTAESMGINDVVAAKEAAYQRYLAR